MSRMQEFLSMLVVVAVVIACLVLMKASDKQDTRAKERHRLNFMYMCLADHHQDQVYCDDAWEER